MVRILKGLGFQRQAVANTPSPVDAIVRLLRENRTRDEERARVDSE